MMVRGQWVCWYIALSFAKLGVTELAIISLLSPIEGVLISAFLFGFSVVAATIFGHELGAGKLPTGVSSIMAGFSLSAFQFASHNRHIDLVL